MFDRQQQERLREALATCSSYQTSPAPHNTTRKLKRRNTNEHHAGWATNAPCPIFATFSRRKGGRPQSSTAPFISRERSESNDPHLVAPAQGWETMNLQPIAIPCTFIYRLNVHWKEWIAPCPSHQSITIAAFQSDFPPGQPPIPFIEQTDRIYLSERDSLRVQELLKNPPAPNRKLLAAARALPKRASQGGMQPEAQGTGSVSELPAPNPAPAANLPTRYRRASGG